MDFVCLDMEHSSMGFETVAHNIRAAQAAMVPPVVRVPGLGPGSNNCKEIMRVLDLGASAVIVPGVQSKSDVEQALAAGMFPRPLAQGGGGGFRGANPFVRAGRHGLEPPPGYHKRSNDEVLIIPLLETPSAMENLETIMQVAGLKVVAFGPFDLSVAMGYDGVRTEEVEAALMRGVQVCIRVWGLGFRVSAGRREWRGALCPTSFVLYERKC
jgi:4-hydroxy-2-oxoheptanedioate aldolase